jgi:hypothetical protein
MIKEEAKPEYLKIQVYLKHKKGRRNIKEPTHVLMVKFDILKKPERTISQIETSDFYSEKIVSISKRRSTLYISQVGPYNHVFQVIHMFLK